jgi:hypothetical protein
MMWAAIATLLGAASAFQGVSAAPQSAGVTKVTAKSAGSQVKLSGWATFSGAMVASAGDSAKDAVAVQGGPASNESAVASDGGELIGADLVYRPELGDLFIRIKVTSIFTTPSVGGAPSLVGDPSVLYGLRTVVSGVPVEIRMQSTGVSSEFGLFDCSSENGCAQAATISGGYGTTGEEIVAAIPLSAFSSIKKVHLKEGDKIGTPTAFVARGTYNAGAVSDAATMDYVVMGKGATVQIPVKSVHVTVGKVTRTAALKNGYFTVSFPTSAWGGKRTATATTRTCLGKTCVVQKFTVSR